MTAQQKPAIRFVSIEPGRISLHGVSLTDGEYAVLRGIAERMKRAPAPIALNTIVDDDRLDDVIAEPHWINEVPTC
jgi:protein gp37